MKNLIEKIAFVSLVGILAFLAYLGLQPTHTPIGTPEVTPAGIKGTLTPTPTNPNAPFARPIIKGTPIFNPTSTPVSVQPTPTPDVVVGATVFMPYQGGTGLSSATGGDVGKCLQVSASSPFTYSLGTCGGTSGVTSFNTRTGAVTLSSGDVTGALGFTPYNATNPSGYISGITSLMVTNALGFTPYNSTNPSNYIALTALSASNPITYNNLTGAIGWTNSNNYIALTNLSATSPIAYDNTTGIISTAAGFSIPLTASSSNWDTFYHTPSSRITAGTNLTWSGNTLNASAALPNPIVLSSNESVTSNSFNWNWGKTDLTNIGTAYIGRAKVGGLNSPTAFIQIGDYAPQGGLTILASQSSGIGESQGLNIQGADAGIANATGGYLYMQGGNYTALTGFGDGGYAEIIGGAASGSGSVGGRAYLEGGRGLQGADGGGVIIKGGTTTASGLSGYVTIDSGAADNDVEIQVTTGGLTWIGGNASVSGTLMVTNPAGTAPIKIQGNGSGGTNQSSFRIQSTGSTEKLDILDFAGNTLLSIASKSTGNGAIYFGKGTHSTNDAFANMDVTYTGSGVSGLEMSTFGRFSVFGSDFNGGGLIMQDNSANLPFRFSFSSNGAGAGFSEKARFLNNGHWLFGTTTDISGALMVISSATANATIKSTSATATASFTIDNSSTTRGACLKLKDQDGVGYTYVRVNNGSLIASTNPCN